MIDDKRTCYAMTSGGTLRGHLWMIRKFGLRRWWGYCRARREGVVIDYGEVSERDGIA